MDNFDDFDGWKFAMGLNSKVYGAATNKNTGNICVWRFDGFQGAIIYNDKPSTTSDSLISIDACKGYVLMNLYSDKCLLYDPNTEEWKTITGLKGNTWEISTVETIIETQTPTPTAPPTFRDAGVKPGDWIEYDLVHIIDPLIITERKWAKNQHNLCRWLLDLTASMKIQATTIMGSNQCILQISA